MLHRRRGLALGRQNRYASGTERMNTMATLVETKERRERNLHAHGDLAAAILARCAKLPTAPVVGGQEGLRWRRLDGAAFAARVEALAAELRARGVGHG